MAAINIDSVVVAMSSMVDAMGSVVESMGSVVVAMGSVLSSSWIKYTSGRMQLTLQQAPTTSQ